VVAQSVLKVHRSSAKATERTMVVTDQAIYLLEKHDRLKYRVGLNQVVGINCFPGLDSVLVVKLEGNKKGDFFVVVNNGIVRRPPSFRSFFSLPTCTKIFPFRAID